MSSPTTPASPFSAFSALRDGFSLAIAPGAPGARIVTLGGGATWWDGDAPITVDLPQDAPWDGTRWLAGGTSQLRVGLGTLDLDARAWRAEPGLAAIARPEPDGRSPVKAAAWLPDAMSVAVLLESRDPAGNRSAEVVIATADGHVRARKPVTGATVLAATDNRVLVAGMSIAMLLDLDANVVAQPALPMAPQRVRDGGGMFAVLGAAGDVALIRPADGSVVAKWDPHALDIALIPNGVVAIDSDGIVHAACLSGGALHEVATAASGVKAAIVQIVGDRVVVAGAGATPVRVATFASPCH